MWCDGLAGGGVPPRSVDPVIGGSHVIGKAKAHCGDAEAQKTGKIEKANPRKTLPLINADDTHLVHGSPECAGDMRGRRS